MKADLNITFYKEEKFKETPIGKIPEDWDIIKLENIGKIVNGFGFPIKYQGKKDGKYLFVKVNDTNLPGNEKFILTTENTIDDDLTKKLRVKIYPRGTIIFPKIGMVIFLRKVRILAKPGTFDNNIIGIIPDRNVIDEGFLYYYFLERVDLTKLAGRTTAPSIRKSEVEKLRISLPPLLEQKAIAHILSTIDEAIQKTNEIIEKTERLKKGLMQELLTKGVVLGFMFDVHVFDEILDGKIELPQGLKYYVTHIQLDEIRNMPESKKERREELLRLFNRVPKEFIPTEGIVLNVSRFDMAKFLSETDVELYDKMLARLKELDEKDGKKKSPENQARDILIVLTCLKNCLTIVTEDKNLKIVAQDFQVPAITFEQFQKGEYREFKDTEIGRIPRDWNIVKLEDVAKFKRGFSYRSQDLNKKPTSIRFITINDIEKEGGIKLNVEPLYLSERIKMDSNFFLESGDLLIANTDMSKGFIIGAPILIEKIETNAVYSMDLTKLIFNNSELESKYLFYYFKYEPTRQRMKSFAQGTNVLHLNHELIKSLPTPIPPLSEQKQIASILSAIDRKLEVERNEKSRLERIKKGFMNKLLTGKIRVRVEN